MRHVSAMIALGLTFVITSTANAQWDHRYGDFVDSSSVIDFLDVKESRGRYSQNAGGPTRINDSLVFDPNFFASGGLSTGSMQFRIAARDGSIGQLNFNQTLAYANFTGGITRAMTHFTVVVLKGDGVTRPRRFSVTADSGFLTGPSGSVDLNLNLDLVSLGIDNATRIKLRLDSAIYASAGSFGSFSAADGGAMSIDLGGNGGGGGGGSVVPEPGSIALFGLGLGIVGYTSRRRRRHRTTTT